MPSDLVRDLRHAVRALAGAPAFAAVAILTLGLAVGIAVSAALTRVFGGPVFGVAPGNARPVAVAAVLLVALAVAACLLPARRASRVDPLQVLRND